MEYERFNHIVGVVVWYHPAEKEVEALSLYMNDVERVVVVDNSETDNSVLCEQLPNVQYISLGENKGIAAALNVGCNEAMKKGAEWVLTMDQDSQWNKHSVRQ